jgi:hypothetical protein
MMLVKKHCLSFCVPGKIKIILKTEKGLAGPELVEPDKPAHSKESTEEQIKQPRAAKFTCVRTMDD